MILIGANINIKTQEFYFFNRCVFPVFFSRLLTFISVRKRIYDIKSGFLMLLLVTVPAERKHRQDRLNVCRISPLKCHFHHPGNLYAHYTFVVNLKSIVINLQYFQAMEVLAPNT